MSDADQQGGTLQDHAAFLAKSHDFQNDIEILTGSELVGTILETVMLATDMRFAAVARVTADRWVACRTVDEVNFGLRAGDELSIQSTFCQSVRETSEMIMFDDVATDEVYKDHPIALKFGISSYASVPIRRSDGSFFGTLCTLDTDPRNVRNPRAVAMLEMFADIIGRSLETEEQLEARDREVEKERELARIQEEFVAVLGHDLRNPVAALNAGLRQLQQETVSERGAKVLPLMRAALHRMSDLIDNIMLHAKARLGGGIQVTPTEDAPLAEAITNVVEETRAATPECEITMQMDLDEPVKCDAPRIAQAVSNLLSNAVRHADPGTAVHVNCELRDCEVVIAISNHGTPIPEEMRETLFDPFERGVGVSDEGLGLGLHIASAIAIAHDGDIGLTCEGGVTTFTLRLPTVPNQG